MKDFTDDRLADVLEWLSQDDVWESVFRGSPRMERNFARLKGRPLGIKPLYVQREDHVLGMVRLLSLALRVLTLIEYVARKALQSTD